MLTIKTSDLDFLEWAPDSEVRYSFQGKPFDGIALDYYDNGILGSEYQYKNGYREGLQKAYYHSGNIEIVYSRAWARFHGEMKKWYPEGELKSETTWIYGHQAFTKEWDEKGTIILEDNIQNYPEKYSAMEQDRIYFSAKE